MRDIDIKCGDGNFKLRTSAIIIKDNKILLQKCQSRNGYGFPRGHVELGELTSDAIIREVKEETGLDVKIENLFCVSELIYKNQEGKTNQEINYYYKLDCLSDIKLEDFEVKENDKGIEKLHHFSWCDIENMIELGVRPIKIAELLQDNINAKNEIIFIDER